MPNPNRSRSTRPFYIALGLLALCGAPHAAAAQVVPGGGEVDFSRGRREYTADALRDFNRFIASWSAAWGRGDAREVAALYSGNPTVAFSDTLVVRGQSALRTFLTTALTRGAEIRFGVGDFVAGEDLSAATGAFVYQQTAEAEPVTGTYFTVLYKERGQWRIRSQVFTPALPIGAPPAQP